MTYYRFATALLRNPYQILVQWVRNAKLKASFPTLHLRYPVQAVWDSLEAITISGHVVVGPFSEILVLRTVPESPIRGELHIGGGTVIGGFANIRAAGGAIRIGARCILAQNVALVAANHSIKSGVNCMDLPWDSNKTGVLIGDNCWIGAGVVVLPGCKIGENCVVAAGSVVTKDVPPGELWGNIPARKLRDISAV